MRVFLFFLIFLSCKNDPKLVLSFVSEEELPIEKIKEAELIETEKGNLKVRITANTIERFQDRQPSLIFSNNI